jgi:photosystem II stability/assembly factor-like uncharacterized protein
LDTPSIRGDHIESHHRAVTLRSVAPLAILLVMAGAFSGNASALLPVATSVTWTQQVSGTGNILHDIDMFDRCTGIAVGHQSEGVIGARPPVMRTSNGGRSWTAATSGVPINTTLNRVAYAGDVSHLWFVGEPVEGSGENRGYIGRSFDGGVTWSNQTLNAPTVAVTADYEGLTTADVATAWIAVSGTAATFGGILYTNDRGLTWVNQTVPDATDPVADVYAVSATNVWAVTDNGKLLHTTNAGSTWTQQLDWGTIYGLPNGSFERINFFDASHGAVVGHDGSGSTPGYVLWTQNGGTTWNLTTIVTGAINDGYDLNAIAFADATTLWIAGHVPDNFSEGEGFSPNIYASTNGGATFTSQRAPVGLGLQGLAAVRGTNQILGVGRGGTVITTAPAAC